MCHLLFPPTFIEERRQWKKVWTSAPGPAQSHLIPLQAALFRQSHLSLLFKASNNENNTNQHVINFDPGFLHVMAHNPERVGS